MNCPSANLLQNLSNRGEEIKLLILGIYFMILMCFLAGFYKYLHFLSFFVIKCVVELLLYKKS